MIHLKFSRKFEFFHEIFKKSRVQTYRERSDAEVSSADVGWCSSVIWWAISCRIAATLCHFFSCAAQLSVVCKSPSNKRRTLVRSCVFIYFFHFEATSSVDALFRIVWVKSADWTCPVLSFPLPTAKIDSIHHYICTKPCAHCRLSCCTPASRAE